jgi:uncharacterized caspase-like protein
VLLLNTLQIVALCIGVSAYKDEALKLKNAAKDARDLAAALRSQGVDVTLLQDPDVNQLRHGVQEFCHDKITKQTPLAIFFYAGHGGLCVGTSDVLAGKHIMMAKCWQDYDINKGGFARVSSLTAACLQDVSGQSHHVASMFMECMKRKEGNASRLLAALHTIMRISLSHSTG